MENAFECCSDEEEIYNTVILRSRSLNSTSPVTRRCAFACLCLLQFPCVCVAPLRCSERRIYKGYPCLLDTSLIFFFFYSRSLSSLFGVSGPQAGFARFILLRISEHFTGCYVWSCFVGRALRALNLPHRPKDFIGVVLWLVSLFVCLFVFTK